MAKKDFKMQLVIAIFVFVFLLNAGDCIGGGSWSEVKRSVTSNDANFAKTIAEDFRRLRTTEEKLQFFRKMCKEILKVTKYNSRFSINKVCRQNISR